MELIRPTRRLGNATGVLLPKELENSLVKIDLIKKPISDIELLNLLNQEISLKNVLGVYLIGSYARGDYDINSDIDILVITSNINKIVKKGNYEINLVSLNSLKEQLENNCLPILAWLKEAKTILNNELINQYNRTKITLKNLQWHIETTKTAMEIIKEKIKLAKAKNNSDYLEGCAYSLVLRLRTLYIIECLKNKRKFKKTKLINLVKKISGSKKAYSIYASNKSKKNRENLTIEEAEKLLNYVLQKNEDIEKWL